MPNETENLTVSLFPCCPVRETRQKGIVHIGVGDELISSALEVGSGEAPLNSARHFNSSPS